MKQSIISEDNCFGISPGKLRECDNCKVVNSCIREYNLKITKNSIKGKKIYLIDLIDEYQFRRMIRRNLK